MQDEILINYLKKSFALQNKKLLYKFRNSKSDYVLVTLPDVDKDLSSNNTWLVKPKDIFNLSDFTVTNNVLNLNHIVVKSNLDLYKYVTPLELDKHKIDVTETTIFNFIKQSCVSKTTSAAIRRSVDLFNKTRWYNREIFEFMDNSGITKQVRYVNANGELTSVVMFEDIQDGSIFKVNLTDFMVTWLVCKVQVNNWRN